MDPHHPDDTLRSIAEGGGRIYRLGAEVRAAQMEQALAAERLSRVVAQVEAHMRGEPTPADARTVNDKEAALGVEMAALPTRTRLRLS